MVKLKFNSNKSIQYTGIDESDNNDCESGLSVIDQQFSSDVKTEQSGDEWPKIYEKICLVIYFGFSLMFAFLLYIWFITSPSHQIDGTLIGLLFLLSLSLSQLVILIFVFYQDTLPCLNKGRDIHK